LNYGKDIKKSQTNVFLFFLKKSAVSASVMSASVMSATMLALQHVHGAQGLREVETAVSVSVQATKCLSHHRLANVA
jgi:hypothetical protein